MKLTDWLTHIKRAARADGVTLPSHGGGCRRVPRLAVATRGGMRGMCRPP